MKAKLIKTDVRTEVRIWEGEEPNKDLYFGIEPELEFSKDMEQYLSSYKSYPVRSEDEEGFTQLAHESMIEKIYPKMYDEKEYQQSLSQGIEIPSERVRIDEYPVQCGGFLSAVRLIKYATLLTEDKEGEGQEVTDDEIAQEARKRYPYSDDDTEARMNKLSSKRRRFIEGAKWMQFEIIQKQNFNQ